MRQILRNGNNASITKLSGQFNTNPANSKESGPSTASVCRKQVKKIITVIASKNPFPHHQ
jgi:hypothetical protein